MRVAVAQAGLHADQAFGLFLQFGHCGKQASILEVAEDSLLLLRINILDRLLSIAQFVNMEQLVADQFLRIN